MAGDDNAIVARDAFKFAPQLGHIAAEALDRLDAQMTGRLHGCDRQRGDANARKAEQLLKRARDREQAHGLGEAVQVMLALFLKIIRLDKSGPSIGWQMITDVAGLRQLGFGGEPGCVSANGEPGYVSANGEPGCMSARSGFRRLGPPYRCQRSRDFKLGHIAQAALTLRRELPDRFNFVTEEFEPARRLGVGRKNVQNPSAPTELAGQRHDFRSPKMMLHEPGGQIF